MTAQATIPAQGGNADDAAAAAAATAAAAAAAGDAKPLKEVIPSEYHDKPYLKDFVEKTQTPEVFADLFKKFDGAQTLIGKKIGIPEGDDQKEWDDFHAKLRLEKPEDYVIQKQEGNEVDPEFAKTLQAAFHAANLSGRQSDLLQGDILKAIIGKQVEATAEQKKADEAFETLAKEALGADNEKVLARAKTALEKHAPENLKAHVEKLDDKSLVILAGVVTSMLDTYAKEDDLGGGGGGANTGGQDRREQGRALMASKEYQDPFHPKHDETVKRVNELYAAQK